MRTYFLVGEFNVPLFSEELVAAFPRLIEDNGGERRALFTLFFDASTLTIKSEIALDQTTLDALAASHDRRNDSRAQARRKRFEVLRLSITTKLTGLGFTAEELNFLEEFFRERAELARAGQ
jgi:hypothetical protein